MVKSSTGHTTQPRITGRAQPESVFGQLKNNRGFRRFLLRGMEKVMLEVGWLSLAHNLLKQAVMDQKQKAAILQ
ncbi:transposase [Paenibacillus riograndensis]|uniref:transposase n=1 Tax=Paenibacillus riograndensis TaxID=483937 RepID=UPI001E5E36E7|nr:transposase [Paenibacillus riograndensis]